MPLLKIGKQYINTDLIVSWGEKVVGNTHYLYGMSSDSQDWAVSFSDPAEIDALLRWLDENSTDIMVTADSQPAPVETPEPKHLWDYGDKVKVIRALDSCDIEYVGRVGKVVFHHRSDGVYDVEFEPDDSTESDCMTLLEEQLSLVSTPAD